MSRRIEDYAYIGDCRTGALVARDGSIDWLCPARFDAPACFAALVGTRDNGHWRIAPVAGPREVVRRYKGDTLILDTEFRSEGGRVVLSDFMAIGADAATVVRIVSGIEGRVAMAMELVVRFEYGHIVPWVSQAQGALVAIAGADLLVLYSPVRSRGVGLKTVARFEVAAGQSLAFVLRHGPGHRPRPGPIDAGQALRETERFWSDWASRCNYRGPWRDAVVRSLVTLKALSYAPTGGIVAAPTTSLPERPAGQRNWDYRYCWLRDATFMLLSLMEAGYRDEADAWRSWLERAVAGSPSQVQPLYTVRGEHRVQEWEAAWLDGFGGSKPVRIGNAAYAQLQLDTFGELLDVLHQARRSGLPSNSQSWPLQKELLKHLESLLDEPDRTIWEFRGHPRQFTYSKVMCWVAYDRAVRGVEDFGLDGPVDHWRELRDRLHAEVCARGFDRGRNSFVQCYGGTALDASALLIPLVGFLPADHPQVVGTVQAVTAGLLRHGLVHRYDTTASDDPLPPGEGAFIACSFWLADNLILQGRLDEGRALFERLLGLCNDVGLLSEQCDAAQGRLLGNFPQALSHLALVGTAYNLCRASGPAHEPGHEPGHGRAARRRRDR